MAIVEWLDWQLNSGAFKTSGCICPICVGYLSSTKDGNCVGLFVCMLVVWVVIESMSINEMELMCVFCGKKPNLGEY